MSRIERLRGYRRMDGPAGEASDEANLEYWSGRASANSKIAPRAKGGEMRLPDTDARAGVAPKRHSGDLRERGKSDKNDVGSSYMPGVRRGES